MRHKPVWNLPFQILLQRDDTGNPSLSKKKKINKNIKILQLKSVLDSSSMSNTRVHLKRDLKQLVPMSLRVPSSLRVLKK